MTLLFREGEVPEDLKGRGVWNRYGQETLFCPFNGPGKAMNSDWICGVCGFEWYAKKIKNEHGSHCLVCDAEMSVTFNSKSMEELFDDG